MNMKYVLANEIERRQCEECFGMWFLFDCEGKEAFYRLSTVEPSQCTICDPIDKDIESKSLMSTEKWIKGDE
jgi:hypothetical protein